MLFAPIPKNINLDDGSAFSLTSLTYKIVFWDMYKESDKPFNSIEFIIFPKNFYPEEDGPLDAAMRIFNKVINEYSCDSNRYYVMGPSMGGYATLEVAAKYNDTFAAAMPSCAAWTASQEKANQLKDVPVLFLHGTNDNIVHHSLSQQNYELIKSVGGTMASIKLYDGADHDLWRYSLKDDSVFEWLFSQSK